MPLLVCRNNVDETVTVYERGGFGGAIVVGIDNTLDRLAEYTYDYEWLAGSRRGNAYMDFVVEVVKAYVDENYNTKPERENTMLLGSSMGGLITFFGGLNHLDTFGMLVPFSPQHNVFLHLQPYPGFIRST